MLAHAKKIIWVWISAMSGKAVLFAGVAFFFSIVMVSDCDMILRDQYTR